MRYVCSICGYVYDEAAGIPDQGIAPGTKWTDLAPGWTCPLCGAPKHAFQAEKTEPAAEPGKSAAAQGTTAKDAAAQEAIAGDTAAQRTVAEESPESLSELSFGELSCLCSNLAKGCEKQYLPTEAGLFQELADYYREKTDPSERNSLDGLSLAVEKDLAAVYPEALTAADSCRDRGAKRALVWSEKVSRMLSSLLERYERENGAFLENANVYVCEICGFIYVGDEPPEICPVCKVPKLKIAQMQRR